MAARRWAGTRRSGSGCGERVGRAGSARSGGGRCPVVRCGDWEGGDDSEGGGPLCLSSSIIGGFGLVNGAVAQHGEQHVAATPR
ncbi:hypothetical protein GSF21_20620, partial [Burkholderia pseudomallei]|nr:hypothetical protein [Burkholderia pseudomallei]